MPTPGTPTHPLTHPHPLDPGILVDDAAEAYCAATAHGGEGVTPPHTLRCAAGGGEAVVAEMRLFGDCVLRFVSGSFQVGKKEGYKPTLPCTTPFCPANSAWRGRR